MASEPVVRWIVWHPELWVAYSDDAELLAWKHARKDKANLFSAPVRMSNKALHAAGWRCTRVEASDEN